MNLYEVLGLPDAATPDEIKKAYRRLVRQWHPDVNKDPEAERRFKQIADAYDILSDPKKRAAYDQRLRFGGSGIFVGGTTSLDDILNDPLLRMVDSFLHGEYARTQPPPPPEKESQKKRVLDRLMPRRAERRKQKEAFLQLRREERWRRAK